MMSEAFQIGVVSIIALVAVIAGFAAVHWWRP
jgi:hypothetical protein